MSATLDKAMQQHTYAIMDEVEGSHWWFVGRRKILESFLDAIVTRLSIPDSRLANHLSTPVRYAASRKRRFSWLTR